MIAMEELPTEEDSLNQSHRSNQRPGNFKLLLLVILITIVNLGLNIGFIYAPEIIYRSQIEDVLNNADQSFTKFSRILNQTELFIKDAQPTLEAIRAVICKYDPPNCPH